MLSPTFFYKNQIEDNYGHELKRKVRRLDSDKYLQEVSRCMGEPSGSPLKIINLLLQAIQLESVSASKLLVDYILTRHLEDKHLTKYVLEKLHLIESGALNTNINMLSLIAFIRAQFYAGIVLIKNNERVLFPDMNLAENHRELMAVGFAKVAIKYGNDEARRFLTTAYSTGKRGCIKPSFTEWFAFNEDLASKGCQSAQLELGCYHLGKLHNGEEFGKVPSILAINVPYNAQIALKYLLIAAKGANLMLAQTAIIRICEHFLKNEAALLNVFNTEARTGSPLIAFYLAFCACPEEFRYVVPQYLQPPVLFSQLIHFNVPDLLQVKEYLESIKISGNSRLMLKANKFLSYLPNQSTENAFKS